MVSRPPPSPPPLDSQPRRPSFQRSNSNLSVTKVPSKENAAHKAPSMGALPPKNRPPAVTIPKPLTPIPPPIPSPASQSDYSITYTKSIAPDGPPPLPRKSSSRPSTASSRTSREDVTPWEFQSSPFETAPSPINDKFEKAPAPTLKSKTSSIKSKPSSLKSVHCQPSLRSRTSSTATGLVEEVTPWELYPPIPEKNTKYHMPKESIPEYITPPNSSPPTTATGFVEDVTPWELVPPPPPPPLSSQESLTKPMSQSLSHLSSVETSTLLSVDSGSQHKLPSSTPPSTHHSHVSGTSSQEPKVLKTGPTEDVTPWELEPGPTSTSTLNGDEEARVSPSTRIRSSLTLAQVEEVTPWELHPAPSVLPPDDKAKVPKDAKVTGDNIVKKKSLKSGNTPASNSSKPLPDPSFARSRKSGSKSSRTRHTYDARISTRQPAQYVALPSPDRANDHDGEIPRYGYSRASDLPPTPRGTAKASISSTGSVPSLVTPVLTKLVKSEPTPRSQFNMSTADRKILTQLEHFKDAHDKEFIIKGKGYHQLGGGVTPGKIHHAFDEESAPYPRCYDARAQDLDVWEIMICHQACNSWTWHVFETPPKTVLDIGCGTGSWITHAAGTWKQSQFWGIDLVPTQPDFTTLGDRDLKERVHWVHHNFLEGLPFEAEFFDYIHIKRVGLGVPEDKWDRLFEECRRVLKSGGAFELLEEDLFFPGKPKDANESSENAWKLLEGELEFPATRESFGSDDPAISQPVSPNANAYTSAPLSPRNNHPYDLPATPIVNHASFAPTPFTFEAHTPPNEPSKHNTFTDDRSNRDKDNFAPLHSTTTTSNGSQPSIAVYPRSAAKPILSIKTRSSGATFASSAVSLMETFGHYKVSPNHANPPARPRSSGTVALARDPPEARSRRSSSHGTQSQGSDDSAPTQTDYRVTNGGPLPPKRNKVPRNPRDHTVLEVIYMEMLASRFINSTPLSILQNYLEYHFTDVRTHPPLLYTFPPTALLHSESRYVTDSETDSVVVSSDEASSDDEEARDAIRPKPPKPKASKSVASATDMSRSRYRCTLGKPSEDVPAEPRFLSFPHLIRRQSPYISFDRSRGYAFSPSPQVQRRSTDGKQAGPMRMSRLPNQTLNLDIKSLNMHLYLRTMDILGCSEPMWEWVVNYQSRLMKTNDGTGMRTPGSGGLLRSMQSDSSLGSFASSGSNLQAMHAIAEMTRDGFEMLLTNFELDMQDQASVDYALQEQVNWRVFASPRDHRRKAFDEACKKWDKWVATQEKVARRLARSRHRSRAGESNGHGAQSPHRRQPDGDLLSAPPPGTAVNGRNSESSKGRMNLKQGVSKLNSSPSSLPPYQRLSRAFRVYVAWKVRDPQSLNQAVQTFNGFDTPNAQ